MVGVPLFAADPSRLASERAHLKDKLSLLPVGDGGSIAPIGEGVVEEAQSDVEVLEADRVLPS